MNFIFYASDKLREHELASAVARGAKAVGAHCEIRRTADFLIEGPEPLYEAALCFGVKGASRAIVDGYKALGKDVYVLDKALIRVRQERADTNNYYRLTVGGSPLPFMVENHDSGRWNRLGIKLAKRQKDIDGDIVVVANSSQKYCDFWGLGEQHAYGQDLIEAICEIAPGCRVLYRLKPAAMAEQGMSPRSIGVDLEGASVLVTHGSSAAIDAIVAGVPVIALGPCAATPIAGTTLQEVTFPPWPNVARRYQWAYNIAWCQWTLDEWMSGEAWRFILKERGLAW